MYLSRLEEQMLNGEYGEATAKALKLIVRVGEALGAEKLVEVTHAHASGISYDNIGEAGLGFIRDLHRAGGRARVFATYNPIGVELWGPSVLPAPPEFLEKQFEIIKSLEAMGFRRSVTCIPYLMRRPRLGEHLAWGESSAVAVANTLYGARTNREGGPIALAAAITGRIYHWGLHLDENRKPTVLLRYQGARLAEPEAGVAGYIAGEVFQDRVVYVDADVEAPRGVQAMCAAAAAAGSTAMCVVRGVSPEDNGPPSEVEDKLSLDSRDVARKKEEIAPAGLEEAELFFTGCPHHGPDKVYEIVRLLDSAKIKRLSRPLWVAVPGYAARELRPIAKRLAERNVHVLPGTCIVVSRLRGVASVVATDSVKTAFYLPRRHGVNVSLASLKEFIAYYGR